MPLEFQVVDCLTCVGLELAHQEHRNRSRRAGNTLGTVNQNSVFRVELHGTDLVLNLVDVLKPRGGSELGLRLCDVDLLGGCGLVSYFVGVRGAKSGIQKFENLREMLAEVSLRGIYLLDLQILNRH